jgi:small subunit ribosomal protein S6
MPAILALTGRPGHLGLGGCAQRLLAWGVRAVARHRDRPARRRERLAALERIALLPRNDRGRLSPEEVGTAVRAYEVMVILDPSLDERTIEPSLDKYLNVIRTDGGTVDNVDVWGRRRMAYEIKKNAEGIYAVISLQAEPATVKEFDRQLSLNESILRTKVMRPDAH